MSEGLKALAGRHVLTGLDRETIEREIYGVPESSETMWMVLDGVCWEIWENPDDGYRGHHEGPEKSDRAVKNTFAPVEVLAIHVSGGDYGSDVLELRHAGTAELVLRVGTEDVDDYYPSWVCEWGPEELA